MLSGLKLWRKVLEDWKKSPKGLKHKGALPKEEFSNSLKKQVERLHENGAASENLVNGFRKWGLFPFNSDAVFELLSSENVISPRKAFDESLLQHLQGLREVPADEAPTEQPKERDWVLSQESPSVIWICKILIRILPAKKIPVSVVKVPQLIMICQLMRMRMMRKPCILTSMWVILQWSSKITLDLRNIMLENVWEKIMGTLCSFSLSEFVVRYSNIQKMSLKKLQKRIWLSIFSLLHPPQDEVESWILSLLQKWSTAWDFCIKRFSLLIFWNFVGYFLFKLFSPSKFSYIFILYIASTTFFSRKKLVNWIFPLFCHCGKCWPMIPKLEVTLAAYINGCYWKMANRNFLAYFFPESNNIPFF